MQIRINCSVRNVDCSVKADGRRDARGLEGSIQIVIPFVLALRRPKTEARRGLVVDDVVIPAPRDANHVTAVFADTPGHAETWIHRPTINALNVERIHALLPVEARAVTDCQARMHLPFVLEIKTNLPRDAGNGNDSDRVARLTMKGDISH